MFWFILFSGLARLHESHSQESSQILCRKKISQIKAQFNRFLNIFSSSVKKKQNERNYSNEKKKYERIFQILFVDCVQN